MRINYANDAERPELVALCIACTADECDGLCDDYRNTWRKIHGYPPLLRSDPARSRAGKYLFRGEMLPLREIARRAGVSAVCLHNRLRRGMSMEDAVIPPVGRPKHPRLAEYRGETRPVSQWAMILGLNRSTLLRRLNMGMTMEEAVNAPVKPGGKRAKPYAARGESKTLYEWAAVARLSVNTMRTYMSCGMTLEEIIEKGEQRAQRKAGRLQKTPH